MLIYVAVVEERFKPVALRFFNTETGSFGEQPYREVPECKYLSVLDGLTLYKQDNDTCCLLGKFGQFYVVTLDCLNIQYLSKIDLLKHTPVNYSVTRDYRVVPKGFKMQDLSHLFANDTFCATSFVSKTYSAGQQRKFFGYDIQTGRHGVIKYPLCAGSKDITYEVVYFLIGKQLGLPVCEAKLGVCCGKSCVLSVYEYDTTDMWESFASYMTRYNLLNEFEVAQKLNQFELFCCYLLLDYVCNQADRHSRNLAVCNNNIYPLYDNGRAFTNSIGHASNTYRMVLERNFKQWYNQYKRVSICFDKLKRLNAVQFWDEMQIIQQNVKRLEAIL